jgi:hypothetical protein
MSEKIMNMLLILLFTRLDFFGLGESQSGPELLSITARVVTLFSRFAQNLVLLLCVIHPEIPSDVRPQIKGRKHQYITQLREILYTDSQDMLVLSSIVTSRYYSCTDGSTSPGSYG